MMAVTTMSKACCGCRACEEICPKHAITMKVDEETFLYPVVNPALCVECGLCEKVCPLSYKEFIPANQISSAFVGKNKSLETLSHSSSGGAFTAIYETYIEKGYLVYGVKFNESLQVIHDCAESLEMCKSFRKSKYIQSNTNGCFTKIAKQLHEGEKILFSGTPCQVAALNALLRAKKIASDNLITVTSLCHGVPSQGLFDAYITEKQTNVVAYEFRIRERHNGNASSRSSRIVFQDKHEELYTSENDPYLRGYYHRLINRPSCMMCKFARNDRVSDFTIADAWHIEKLYPDLIAHEGVSLLLFDTEKAMRVLGKIKEKMTLKRVPLDWALKSQKVFYAPIVAHKNRSKFFEMLPKCGFRKAVFQCTKPPLKRRLIVALCKCIPRDVKNILKNICKGF